MDKSRLRPLAAALPVASLLAFGLPATASAATSPVTTVAVGGMPTGTVIAQGRAYVSNQTLNQLDVIDVASSTLVTSIPVGAAPQPPASSPDGSRVFVSNNAANTVSIVSTVSNSVIATVPVGASPGKPAVSATHAYVSNFGSNSVSVIDIATNSLVATIPVGTNPSTGVFGTGNQYSSYSTNLYVANRNSGSISIIDTTTNSVSATIFGAPQISQAAVSPSMSSVGSQLFTSNISGGQLTVLSQDPARSRPDDQPRPPGVFIPVGNGPSVPAVSGDGAFVYVANAGDDSVSAVSADGSAKTVTIPVGDNPGDPQMDATGVTAYVPNAGSSTISAISTAKNAVSATYEVGSGPMGISVTPDGSTLVVANRLSGSVSIVKTSAASYPKAPTKITVKSSSSKSATISWKKSTSSGVTGYVVTALPGGKTCSTKKTTCTIKKLSGGTKYTFAVQATSKYGAGIPRNSSTVTVKK
jgi:YVTN family beta-propeller protein